MTTIIAIECKDGIVMGADTQATEARTWDYAIKVKTIDKFSLMACAGITNYTELFARYIRNSVSNRESKDYYEVINSAVESYSAYIAKRNEKIRLPRENWPMCYPQAAFATNDLSGNSYRLFEIKTPHPPTELEYPYRVAVGSGDISAVAFLKNVEFAWTKLGLSWRDVSTKLASQLCWILLKRIEHVEPGTSGALLYEINDSGAHLLTGKEVWGGTDSWFAVVLRTALAEIPPETVRKNLRRLELWDVYEKLLPLITVG